MTAKDLCDAAISLDADLQDDINAIDEMVEKYLNGADVVYGVRSKRATDTFFKKFTAESFYKLMNGLGANTVYNHADYRLMSRRALQALSEFGEVNLFLRGIVPMVGFNSDVVYYERAERFAAMAHRHNVPLVVDNTFATPYLYRPAEDGAAVIIESLTKWIGGHGATIGGAVIDSGKFDWEAVPGKFPTLTEPDESYHGAVWTKAAPAAPFATRVLAQRLRDIGPTLSPYAAQIIGLGIETLSLRVERHSQNALAVAEFLKDHPKVSWVRYSGLPDDPSHEVASRLLHGGYGGALVFGVKGGREAGLTVINNVKLHTLLANVGDAKSLIIHPASTTHSQLTAEQLEAAHLSEDLIRLSVGIENVEDIIADLDQALAAV